MHFLPRTPPEITTYVHGKGNGLQRSTPYPNECVTPPKADSGLTGRAPGFQVSPEKTVSMRTLTCWAEVSGREVPSFTTAG